MHAVLGYLTVVVVTVSAIGLLVVLLAPRTRGRLAPAVLAAMAGAAATTAATGGSGVLLSRQAGVSEAHRDYGFTLLVLVLLLLVAAVGWHHLQRLAARPLGPDQRAVTPGLEMLAGIAALALAFATLVIAAAAWQSGG